MDKSDRLIDALGQTADAKASAAVNRQSGNLKKVLGFKDVLAMAIGQTVGSGVMTMTGIAIGMTGRGVVLAYILSSLFIAIMCVPSMLLGSALPTTGGSYRYISRLVHPAAGLYYLFISPLASVSLSVFAISFADYMQTLLPMIPFKVCSVGLLTLAFICNLFGVKWVAKIRNIMLLVMAVSFASFVGYGLPKVDISAFTPSAMAPNGILMLLTASGFLTFATGGSSMIVNMGGEMKKPGRDIPLAMALSPLIVGTLYALVALVASGVLPLSQVAERNLAVVAQEIMPTPLYLFFIIGGALFAIATALNSSFALITKPALAACEDGWLPNKLGAVSKRFGTPHVLLTAYYLLCLLPVAVGISLTFVATLGSAVALFRSLMLFIAIFTMQKKYPDAVSKAPFRVGLGVQKLSGVIAFALASIQIVLLCTTMSAEAILASAAYLAAALATALVVYRRKRQSLYTGDAIKDFS